MAYKVFTFTIPAYWDQCNSWYVTCTEKHRLTVFETNSAERNMWGLRERSEGNVKLHNLYVTLILLGSSNQGG
jgi:hypothetical protein